MSQTVDDYLAQLDHPHKAAVQRLRRAILALDPSIGEEVKWNAPSFRREDHFATFRLHPGATFQLILHAGAKAKSNARKFTLEGPPAMLKWAATDRCVVQLAADTDDAVVVDLVRQWLAQL